MILIFIGISTNFVFSETPTDFIKRWAEDFNKNDAKVISKFYEKKVFENADLIIFNTKTDKDNYCQKYKYLREKSLVVRNGFGEVISNVSSIEKGKKLKISMYLTEINA